MSDLNSTSMRKVLMGELRHLKHMPIAHELTLPNMFIADIASITKAGLVCEFEIKTTKADYLNDFKKNNGRYYKHEQLSAGSHGEEIEDGHGHKRKVWLPNYFYFVIPQGMIEIVKIPDYAGVYEIRETEQREGYLSWLYPKLVRRAPRLHGEKVGENKTLNEIFMKRLTNIAVDYQHI